jgi:hypothetical protein
MDGQGHFYLKATFSPCPNPITSVFFASIDLNNGKIIEVPNGTHFVPIIKPTSKFKTDSESPDTYNVNALLFMNKFKKNGKILTLSYKRDSKEFLITNLQISKESSINGYCKCDYKFGYSTDDRYLHIQKFNPLLYSYAHKTLSIYPSIDVKWFPSGCINMVQPLSVFIH